MKNKMLKSVYQHGGFYIGKYETGTNTARTAADNVLTTAVIQANKYPYTYVTQAQAQELASGMESGEYTSSVIFGIQWDLVMKYLQTKGTSLEELNGTTTGSTSWGNYVNSAYNITDENAKYSNNGRSWTNRPYGEKASGTNILLTTGAHSQFSKMGIYNLASNVFEWTLEQRTTDSSNPCTYRGGDYCVKGNEWPAAKRSNISNDATSQYCGFRVVIY